VCLLCAIDESLALLISLEGGRRKASLKFGKRRKGGDRASLGKLKEEELVRMQGENRGSLMGAELGRVRVGGRDELGVVRGAHSRRDRLRPRPFDRIAVISRPSPCFQSVVCRTLRYAYPATVGRASEQEEDLISSKIQTTLTISRDASRSNPRASSC